MGGVGWVCMVTFTWTCFMQLMLRAGWGGGVGWRGNVHLRLLHEVDATRWMGGVGLV